MEKPGNIKVDYGNKNKEQPSQQNKNKTIMPPVKKPHSGNHGNASNKSVGVIQTGKKTEK